MKTELLQKMKCSGMLIYTHDLRLGHPPVRSEHWIKTIHRQVRFSGKSMKFFNVTKTNVNGQVLLEWWVKQVLNVLDGVYQMYRFQTKSLKKKHRNPLKRRALFRLSGATTRSKPIRLLKSACRSVLLAIVTNKKGKNG